jgi:DNA polymerase-1
MIKAFALGGCFHSRTAMGMYSHIREAVDSGKVLLEWDYSKGQPTSPLVKDQFGSERRKAKTLNFSIAYGKTAFGLAKDWGTTKAEAEETLNAWYNDRPEVEKWQKNTQKHAKKDKFVRTLMGRRRDLPDAASKGSKGSHSLRAAINTPIQGGAADIVVMAMIQIYRSEKIKKLGYKLLLQIHDEVILEGPKEHAEEALAEVRYCMENPFDDKGLKKLQVHLDVDGKTADTWYQAK